MASPACVKEEATVSLPRFRVSRSSQKPVQGGLKPTAAMQAIKDFDAGVSDQVLFGILKSQLLPAPLGAPLDAPGTAQPARATEEVLADGGLVNSNCSQQLT